MFKVQRFMYNFTGEHAVAAGLTFLLSFLLGGITAIVTYNPWPLLLILYGLLAVGWHINEDFGVIGSAKEAWRKA